MLLTVWVKLPARRLTQFFSKFFAFEGGGAMIVAKTLLASINNEPCRVNFVPLCQLGT